ncbi:MAG: phosphatase PAP2 family protein [Cyclobacteriaceae bacterium]
MIDYLVTFDKTLFFLLNGWGSQLMDQFMLFLSAKYPWIPLYAVLVGLLVWKYKASFWIPLLYVLAVFALNDQFTSGFMKPFFERLRPCHDSSLLEIKRVGKCGGTFGFASSHAANTMGLAISYFFLFGRTWWTTLLVVWAILVGYSRIYLGVHFPGDVIIGFMVGISAAYLLAQATHVICLKFKLISPF